MNSARRLTTLVLTLLVSAAMTGALAQSELTIMQNEAPRSMDPANHTATFTAAVLYPMYENLVDMTEDQQLVPGLASEWTINEDGTVYDFVLREGVTFHDGTPLDAAGAVVSLERLLDPDAGLAGAGRFQPVIERVSAVDERTVRIELFRPNAAFLTLMSGSQAAIVSPTAWEASTLDRQAVGTGPYRFVEWVSGERVVMEANPDYWGGAPEVERLVWTWSPEDAVMTMSLQAGEVDIATPLPPLFAPVLGANPDIDVLEATGSRVFWIALTTTIEPLDDARVRRALNHATDRQGLIDALLRGFGVPATSPLSPPLLGFDPTLEGLPFDLEVAANLLAEAGVADGFTVNVAVQEADANVVEALQAMWAQVGVQLNIQVMESGVWSEAAFADPEGKARDEVHAVYASWAAIDPDAQLRSLYHSASWAPGGANLGFYANERLDELLDIGVAAIDVPTRLEAYAEAQRILLEDAPHVWLYYPQALAAVHTDVDGVWMSPAGQLMIRQPRLP